VTVLNELEDQLDRFIEPSVVTQKLATAALTATEAVILNADDQNLIRLFVENESQLAEVSWFGVDQAVLLDSRHGQGIAPTYLPDLSRPVAVSSVTGLQQLEALVSVASNQGTVALPNRGLHFAVDAIAALESARRFLKADFDADLANQTLSDLPPVFARGELVQIDGKSIEFILVQNPTSFQLNLDNLDANLDRVMIAIGRDVHDPSWLWTVDFSNLSHVDVVSGFNAAEMALRLHYAEVPFDSVEDDLESAFASFMALGDPAHGVRTVIFSADSMRRLRRQLGLTDPEDVGR
jgi:UDP-N-acetylmuramyl tripeptide synthase